MSTSSKSVGDGPFFIHIIGLPRNYTWQDLKDLIRCHACHGVWTDMQRISNYSVEGQGFARIKRESEARNLFEALCNGDLIDNDLNVHLWDISHSEPRLMKCNCFGSPAPHKANPAFRGFAKFAHYSEYWRDRTPLGSAQGSPSYSVQPNISYAAPYSSPGSYVSIPQQPLVNQFQTLGIQSQIAANAVPQQYTYPAVRAQQANYHVHAQAPVLAPTTDGIVKNVSKGYAVVESRGVHIRNMDFSVSKNDIIRYFSKAGRIVECNPAVEKATGKFKGHATIRYSTAKEAEHAIERFDGQPWRGRPVQVKLDKNPTVVQAPATSSSSRSGIRSSGTPTPVIVNGSSGLQVR